jgi:hypothetical protein
VFTTNKRKKAIEILKSVSLGFVSTSAEIQKVFDKLKEAEQLISESSAIEIKKEFTDYVSGLRPYACSCNDYEHMVVITRCIEDDDEIYVVVRMIRRGFFRRLKKAIVYLFGRKTKYGHWEEFCFKDKDRQELLKVFADLPISEKVKN